VGEATFKNSDASIASQVSQVRSSGAAVIADCSYVPGGVSAMRQLRAAGITAPILAGGSMDGAYWTKATPGLNDYYVATMASVFGDSPSSDVNRFTKRFTEVTGAAPLNQTAAIGYSVGQAIARAIERAKGSTDGTALRDVLNNFKDEQLLIGPTSFDAKTHIVVNRPMEILKYTNAVPAYMKNVKQATQVDLGLG
jgi:branched-chain amino acid transport system substrate-binding protein